MATKRTNQWLDEGHSDEDDLAVDESEQEESRGTLAGRSLKRRKVELNRKGSDYELSGEEDDANASDSPDLHDERAAAQTNASPDSIEQTASQAKPTAKTVKPLTQSQLSRSQAAARKTGVIYISRIPPFMKPSVLRTLLTPHASHGGLGRVFLSPESAQSHQQRVRNGGNRKKSYVDGWVEFTSKQDAKITVELLNGNIVGGKKGGYYHDDIWNMKYLKGFKWKDLTEQIANEDAERAARLRAEIARTKRENAAFVGDVERGKALEGMRAKRESKAGSARALESEKAVNAQEEGRDEKLRRREFKQNKARIKANKPPDGDANREATSRVLSKLF